MRIQRMAFIQHDPQSGVSQVLFLLRSGHDLELECQVRDRKGNVEQEEPVRLAYTLSDAFCNQLDRHRRNSNEGNAAWRDVVAHCLMYGNTPSRMMGLVAIAEFGEPCWQLDEELTIVTDKMTQVVRVHQRG